MMHIIRKLVVLSGLALWLLGKPAIFAANGSSLLSIEAYANFHAGGVVATISGDDNSDAALSLEWRRQGEVSFRSGHPLTRIDETHFVGSLFWLSPAQGYEVKVTLSDPDGISGDSSRVANLNTRLDTFVEPTLRTLYVSNSGSDSNSGTSPANPLKTIQHASDISLPGDLILIQPGIYRESVSLTVSGTADQPIVFRGAASGVIVDGADETIAAGVLWISEGGGVYSYLSGFSTGHVVADTGRFFQYLSLAELQILEAGAPGGFFFDGARLYIKFADGSSPGEHEMHVARHENGFYLNGLSHVRIENIEIRHFGAGSYGKGVYLRYSNDCAVRLCKIYGFQSAGVWLKGGGRNLIEGNEFWDTSIFSWPWGSSKGSSAENNAVSFTDDIGRGNLVRRNTIHGTFNGIGPCGSAAPPDGFTSETDIYDNILYQHTDDAIEPEGYCANVRLWNNHIQDVHMAFAVAPAAPGPVYILRNVVFRFGNTRTSLTDGYTASAIKINSGYPTPIGPLYLYHNTFLTDVPDTNAIALLNPGYSTFIRARNNIFAGTRYALYKVNPVILDWDRDCLYSTDSNRLVSWHGTTFDTLADFQTATNQELNGIVGEPGLSDPVGGDFTPTRLSLVVDRGELLPGINDRFSGKKPDIGAYEFRSTPVPSIPGLLLDD